MTLGLIRGNAMSESEVVSRYWRCAAKLKIAAGDQNLPLADRDFLTGLAHHYERIADDLRRENNAAIASSDDVVSVPKAA